MENTEKQLEEQKQELAAQERAHRAENNYFAQSIARGGNQEEYIFDLTQPPEMVGSQKERPASRFREIENSGIEIDPESDVQRED